MGYPLIATWERKLESDVNLDSDEWEWLKPHLADVMAEVEKRDVIAELLSVRKLGHIVALRAHYPAGRGLGTGAPDKLPSEFEEGRWCSECRRKVDGQHDLDECRVRGIMES